jgi:hypothetical protein
MGIRPTYSRPAATTSGDLAARPSRMTVDGHGVSPTGVQVDLLVDYAGLA